LGQKYLSSIALSAKSQNVMTEAENQIGYLLLSRHNISDPTQADFSIFSQQDILNAASSTTGIFTTLLSGVAAISLLVGGIGVMNIMLVSVVERKREIGIRLAVGARRSDIRFLFLIEAVMLSLVGGISGVILGVIIAYIIALCWHWEFIFFFWPPVIGFSVSVAIGIFFGFYPAYQASQLDPIDALRSE